MLLHLRPNFMSYHPAFFSLISLEMASNSLKRSPSIFYAVVGCSLSNMGLFLDRAREFVANWIHKFTNKDRKCNSCGYITNHIHLKRCEVLMLVYIYLPSSID